MVCCIVTSSRFLSMGFSNTATGFDTGPANCLMDAWARQHLGTAFDADGAWAASSSADAELVAVLLDDPYFALSPPKSTGTQYFSRGLAKLWPNMMIGCAVMTPAGS